MKIISKKEYNRLKEIESKYKYFTGQEFTIFISGRSRRIRLMQLPKEELVKLLLDTNSQFQELFKSLYKGDKK